MKFIIFHELSNHEVHHDVSQALKQGESLGIFERGLQSPTYNTYSLWFILLK